MFNLFAFAYAGLAARNPAPFLGFAMIFFGLLLGPTFVKAIFDPGQQVHAMTPEDRANVDRKARQELQAKAQVYDYCAKNRIAPWVYVWTIVDGEKHSMMCTMGMPLRK